MMSCLIVGEGNLSFSLSLAKLLISEGNKLNIWTSTYEDETTCIKKYGDKTSSNILWLKENGVKVFHSVDAKDIQGTLNVGDTLFKKVIFNFPHIGRKAGIKRNRALLKEFLASCKQVLTKDGCVEITLCAGQGGTPADTKHRETQNHWQIVEMAAYSGFILNEVLEFDYDKYPEYKCTGKRGAGNEFILEGAITHTFVQAPTILQLNEDWDVLPLHKVDYNTLPPAISKKLNLAKDPNQFLAQKYFQDVFLSNFKFNPQKDFLLKVEEDNSIYPQKDNLDCGGIDHLHISSKIKKEISLAKSLLKNLEFWLFEIHSNQTQYFSYGGPVINLCNTIEDLMYSQVHYEVVMIQKGMLNADDISSKIFKSYSPENNSHTFEWKNIHCKFTDNNISSNVKQCLDNYNISSNVRHGIDVILHNVNDCNYSTKSLTLITVPSTNSNAQVIGLQAVVDYKQHIYTIILLDMDLIACILISGLSIPDQQIVWSLNKETQLRLQNACLRKQVYKLFSLYPTKYEFHISFWLNDYEDIKNNSKNEKFFTRLEYSPSIFMNFVKNVLDDLIVNISLADEYVMIINDVKRISHCYKIALQSHDFVLSHNDGRKLELKLRSDLEKYLPVVVR